MMPPEACPRQTIYVGRVRPATHLEIRRFEENFSLIHSVFLYPGGNAHGALFSSSFEVLLSFDVAGHRRDFARVRPPTGGRAPRRGRPASTALGKAHARSTSRGIQDSFCVRSEPHLENDALLPEAIFSRSGTPTRAP